MEKSRLVMFLTVQSNSRLKTERNLNWQLLFNLPDEHPENAHDDSDPSHVWCAEEIQVAQRRPY